jgi:hypothetical protein
MFKSRDVKFNENSVLNQEDENIVDIKITEFNKNDNNEDEIDNDNDENDNDNDENNNDNDENDNKDDNENDNIDDENDQNEIVENDNEQNEEQEQFEDPQPEPIIKKEDVSDDLDNFQTKRTRKQTVKYVPGESMTQKKRTIKQNFANLVNIIDNEPETFQEAINSQFSSKWKEAIKSEVDALIENKTWTEMVLPNGKKIINTRWVFKLKTDSNNVPVRFKARLVAKGYNQEKGINYTETFAPVVKHQSLRLLLAIVTKENLHVHHIDISTAFLYGELDDEIYIDIPEGLESDFKKNSVLKLNKALYGLKQAPRLWNKT